MSVRWLEFIDVQPGRPPVIHARAREIVYELRPLAGLLANGSHFRPTPATRLVLRCDAIGGIHVRISERAARRWSR